MSTLNQFSEFNSRRLNLDILQNCLAERGIELTGQEPPELLDEMIEALAAEEGFGLAVEPEDLVGAFDEPFPAPADVVEFERQRQARIAAGVEHACQGCGCSESRACDGGCIWIHPTICSRCWKDGVR